MKNLFLLLAMALPTVFFTSCDDDNDVPNVDVTVQMEGVTRVDNTLYVVQGEPLKIASITLTDNTKKGAVIGSATYFWDYYRVGGTIVAPYGMTIDTEGVPVGNHLLQISMSIYAVDYSPSVGVVEYQVKVVADESDIPSSGDVEPDPVVKAVVTTTEEN